MGARVVEGARCPQCSAALRPGAPWCTQCYAAVPSDAPTAPPAVVHPAPPEAMQPAARPSPGPSWPCAGCGNANPITCDVCLTCGTAFLAAVRQAAPALVLPLVGDLVAMSSTRRAGLAVALGLALLLVTAALGLLLR